MDQTQLGLSNSNNDAIVSVRSSAQLDTLPEDCIAMVISRTSPLDACVVACVSKTVKSAADSDLVWEKFLPPEYSALVPPSLSKKEMYMSLADDSVLIDDGKKSFWLEKASGKKCYMLSAMELMIVWSDTPDYWQWDTLPESKFEKVAELRDVCWFEIRGKISCGMLSMGTHYSVYLVFKRAGRRSYGFKNTRMEAQVGFVGKEATKTVVFLEPSDKERRDGWREVKLGKFYMSDGDDGNDDEIEFSIMEIKRGNWKSGLIFQGVEIRPTKEGEEDMIITK